MGRVLGMPCTNADLCDLLGLSVTSVGAGGKESLQGF